uniref:TPM_phosphatase domain-containing protein n=1 Tax=Strongyloides papillosus TaxID=174720 RepID=A0A0N5B4W8_STREA
MLSLISLILASGSILKGETEEWTAATYPNPSINATLCNTWQNATLCDPDHILSEHWRSVIIENIERQKSKILSLDKIYTDSTPIECYTNSTVEIYVILARKIKTASNESTTNDELIKFGDDIVSKYGLNDKKCNNYVMLLGVEAAKIAYVRAGTSLKLPKNFFHTVFNRTTNLFREKNYMEGLNKIIDEMGDEMVNLFNEIKQTTESINNESIETTIPGTLSTDNVTDTATFTSTIDNQSSLNNVPKSLKYNMPIRRGLENDKEITSYNGINTYEENLMNAFFIILIILFFILFVSILVLIFSQYYKKHNDSGLTDVVTAASIKTVISPPIVNEAKFKDRHNDIQPDPEFLDMLKRRESSRFSEVNISERENSNIVTENENEDCLSSSIIPQQSNTCQLVLNDEVMKTDHYEVEKIKNELKNSTSNLDVIEEVDETSSAKELPLTGGGDKILQNNEEICSDQLPKIENDDAVSCNDQINVNTLTESNRIGYESSSRKNDNLINDEKLDVIGYKDIDNGDVDIINNNNLNGEIFSKKYNTNRHINEMKDNGKDGIITVVDDSTSTNTNDNLHTNTHIDNNNNSKDEAKNVIIPMTTINLSLDDDENINVIENSSQIE